MQRDCVFCLGDGLVVVGTHKHAGAMYEEMGPCPGCEKGHRLEFGEGDARHPGRWGEAGFWQGRPHNLVPQTKVWLSKAENARRAKDLMATVGLVPKEMAA